MSTVNLRIIGGKFNIVIVSINPVGLQLTIQKRKKL